MLFDQQANKIGEYILRIATWKTCKGSAEMHATTFCTFGSPIVQRRDQSMTIFIEFSLRLRLQCDMLEAAVNVESLQLPLGEAPV